LSRPRRNRKRRWGCVADGARELLTPANLVSAALPPRGRKKQRRPPRSRRMPGPSSAQRGPGRRGLRAKRFALGVPAVEAVSTGAEATTVEGSGGRGSEGLNSQAGIGLMQARESGALKGAVARAFGGGTDVALDPYSSDGPRRRSVIRRPRSTTTSPCRFFGGGWPVSHAEAGSRPWVVAAPPNMMDGPRARESRESARNAAGHTQVSILSYCVKYALGVSTDPCFRDALDFRSQRAATTRRTYQNGSGETWREGRNARCG